MSENRVFSCAWRAEGERFRVWVRALPRIAAEGDSFAEADERLYEAIMRATGDGENSREYSPLPPVSKASGVLQVLRFVGPVSRATVLTPMSELYDSVCPQCGYRTGARTAVPLAVGEIPINIDAFRAGLGRPAGGNGRVLCVSSEFLELMGDAAHAGFEWREVERPLRARRRFFELVSAPNVAQFVILKDATVDPPWRCDTCGIQGGRFHYVPRGEPANYVACADARVLDERAWQAVALLRTPFLLTTREVWGGLSGKKGVRGIQSYDVGVVDPERVDPHPRFVLRSTWPTATR